MDKRTKNAIASQRDEILRYVEENEGSRYSRVDFDALRKQALALGIMIDKDIEPAKTSITYADLIDAFNAKWTTKNAYDESCTTSQ
ncbi:MAG: hypothetical protein IKE20_07680 [Eggerthellaceae bacterium]|nr:hypothetical protein [Eggerthellaceae bacterium]MBR3160048.1 hypothetical protein [Atopobiaceae bacterium]